LDAAAVTSCAADAGCTLPSAGGGDEEFSLNVGVARLPLRDVRRHYRNINAVWAPGTILLIDFPFKDKVGDMGLWLEVLLPVYSQLAMRRWTQLTNSTAAEGSIVAALFFNLEKKQFDEAPWAADLVELALRPAAEERGAALQLLFWDDLEGLSPATWLGFERLLHVHSRHSHPARAAEFASPELAAQFRAAAYAVAGLPPPGAAPPAPRIITYLMPSEGCRVANSKDVMVALHEAAAPLGMRVRPYTATSMTPLRSLVSIAARSGALVGRHCSLLGLSAFLPPGAVVAELLPHNWEAGRIDETYKNITSSIGDVHHFAWRAPSVQWMRYQGEKDERYCNWTAEECASKPCLEAQERAGLMADGGALRELLAAMLPRASAGEGVAALAAEWPWPPRIERTGNTGLWWDQH
jgi:hypothetical protein